MNLRAVVLYLNADESATMLFLQEGRMTNHIVRAEHYFKKVHGSSVCLSLTTWRREDSVVSHCFSSFAKSKR